MNMTETTPLVRTEADGAVVVIAADSPPVNALSAALRQALAGALEEAVANPSCQAIVLLCRGRTFFAGADISEFGRKPVPPTLRDLEGTIERSPKPVIAAIHGNALGGGLELALACRHRVAERSARLGLPEINLGLVPGAGGTQRLPRLVGLRRSLEIITGGKPVSGDEALAAGLVDAVCAPGELEAAARRFANEWLQGEHRSPPIAERAIADAPTPAAAAELVAAFRETQPRRQRDLPAQQAALALLRAAVEKTVEEGMELERQAFVRLLGTPESAAQRYCFFAERKAAKVPGLPARSSAEHVKHVGIVGSGTMGGGIAMVFANAGIRVTVTDVKQEALDRGLATIRRNYDRSVTSGRFTGEQVGQRLALIHGAVGLAALADCDLVVEAAFERMDVKQAIFRELDGITRPDAILATNTSALDIDVIAQATTRPAQVIGLHFFSPANVMKLLEVVRAKETSDAVLATSMALARRIGKIGVVVGVCKGFVGNRMLAARRAQAMAMLDEGALPWDVDRALTDFGFPMGPFAMSDLAGLDLGWRRESSNPQVLRDRLCELDRRGQKTGAGYYDYDAERRPTPSPVVEAIVRELAAARGHAAREIPAAEIIDRSLLAMVNEGARILAEGKALRGSDVDVIWVNGYGWPAHRGGPMYWADSIGPAKVVEKLHALAERHGKGLAPAPLLVELAGSGRKLSEWEAA
ncbi:MAG: 3-hydroxyacyl-CoA dehydrogenase NAD-binding domain-containing protein [Rubrivivax sp.]